MTQTRVKLTFEEYLTHNDGTDQRYEFVQGESAILYTPPLLAIEVISPDYRDVDIKDKLVEYQSLGIPEYWTVDWNCLNPNVTVRNLSIEGFYTEKVFTGLDKITSPMFPELELTVADLLDA
ncbi:Uma2 family endonuclease [Planktothrix paucivesiculata]|uniref:Putative restriction endonuclease domain-containing protein n=1 Tax=Planktothrix paucivesiculata PCC 9631 TaxID=671071 RepID=A0A7Z9E4C6_9CYAN|nr:Uma2 family endonuclease [Planktothrix paucivesiculata]VXD24149.1 hypothetical protein PL9631_780036 [Planktothrix paucivesiculata PCC 9631]